VKIFVQDIDGEHNLTEEYNFASLRSAVEYFQRNGGYYTDKDGLDIFVPYHRIAFIRIDE